MINYLINYYIERSFPNNLTFFLQTALNLRFLHIVKHDELNNNEYNSNEKESLMHSMLSETNIITEQPLLDSLPVAIVIVDSQGVIHYSNPQAEQTLGLNTFMPDHICNLSSSLSLETFSEVINHQNPDNELLLNQIITIDHNENTCHLKMVSYSQTQQHYLMILTPETLLNDKLLTKKFQALKENFNELKQFSRLSAMREISTSLADRLNQPLTAILSYTQAMQRLYQVNATSEEILDAMERVVVNAEHAGQIIRDIRTQINANTLNCQPVCINELIRKSLQLTELDNHDCRIELITNFETQNTYICVDPIQFRQLILSLLHNAIEAVQNPQISSPAISISTYHYSLGYCIVIKDNGPGIPDHIQSKLFEPFNSNKENGIGIGLSMCHHIIDLHRGHITIEPADLSNNNSTGTIVRIQLPDSYETNTSTKH